MLPGGGKSGVMVATMEEENTIFKRERASRQMSQLLRDVSAATSPSESICLSDVDLPD